MTSSSWDLKRLLERLGLHRLASRVAAELRGLRARFRGAEGWGPLELLAVLSGKGSRVIEGMLRCFSMDSAAARMTRAVARVEMTRGQLTAAERNLRRALDRNPKDVAALDHLSFLLAWMGKPDEAIRMATAGLQISSSAPLRHDSLAFALARGGRGFEAGRSIRAAVAVVGRRVGDNHILMLHYGRCGSTVVADMLAQHSRIRWDREIYTPRRRLWHPDTNPLTVLRSRMALAEDVYGFEFKPAQSAHIRINLRDFLALLSEVGVTKLVYLHRENLLRRFISHEVSVATDRWHTRTGRREVGRIEVDVQGRSGISLLQRLEALEREVFATEAALETYPHLALTYESDVTVDPRVAYQRICDYAGLEPREVAVNYYRTNPFPLQEMITNYAEMEAQLRSTRFAWMLSE